MKLQFATVDVFTDRQFGGNPLAVVTNAQGLSTERMQAIAAEFNLAETTFVLPPRDPAHTAEVRIFTPKAEMPFAGHPNVGTAFVLARAGDSYGRPVSGDRLVFEEKAGLVHMDLMREGGIVVATRLAARSRSASARRSRPRSWPPPAGCRPPTSSSTPIGRASPRAARAAVRRTEVARRDSRPRTARRRLRPRPAAGSRRRHPSLRAGQEGGIDIQSRMFAPRARHARGSRHRRANVALIGLLAHLRPEPDLTLDKTIGQGFDMGRPSILVRLRPRSTAGKVVATYIGGRCMPMMSGVIDLG